MSWGIYTYIVIASALLWIAGSVLSFTPGKRGPALAVSIAGSLVFAVFITGLWISLERPPMRTQGETRLWYSLFVSLAGIFIYGRWGYKWVLPLTSLMATVFALVNVFKPEIHDKALMPALQSGWFIPHVAVYMIAYAILGAVTLFAIVLWVRSRKSPATKAELSSCDTLVRIGWGFLTLGIVMGALWAKQAWGDYWNWDPKETWAAVTWVAYLLYMHARPVLKDNRKAFALLVFCFILLQFCWWGVNYLPSAQDLSVHTY